MQEVVAREVVTQVQLIAVVVQEVVVVNNFLTQIKQINRLTQDVFLGILSHKSIVQQPFYLLF